MRVGAPAARLTNTTTIQGFPPIANCNWRSRIDFPDRQGWHTTIQGAHYIWKHVVCNGHVSIWQGTKARPMPFALKTQC